MKEDFSCDPEYFREEIIRRVPEAKEHAHKIKFIPDSSGYIPNILSVSPDIRDRIKVAFREFFPLP